MNEKKNWTLWQLLRNRHFHGFRRFKENIIIFEKQQLQRKKKNWYGLKTTAPILLELFANRGNKTFIAQVAANYRYVSVCVCSCHTIYGIWNELSCNIIWQRKWDSFYHISKYTNKKRLISMWNSGLLRNRERLSLFYLT